MMKPEQYENLISLMQEALKFYADQRNYAGYMGDPASIDLDEYGSQARFALKKVEETLDADKKLQEDYNKVISETIKAIEDTPIDLTSVIKTFKNLGND